MLSASGANFSLLRSLSHIFKNILGHVIMIGGLGLGLAQILAIIQAAHTVLKVCSAIYMTDIAYKFATAKPPSVAAYAPQCADTFRTAGNRLAQVTLLYHHTVDQ